MTSADLALRLETAPRLRTYATYLPLGLRELDAAVASESDTNPWLEIIERPLGGIDGDAIGRIAARGPRLWEHLEGQLTAADAGAAVGRAAEYIIGSLDPHAYLRDDLTAVSARAHVAPQDARSALELVQSFDPPGVAARDLGERFRLKLNDDGDAETLVVELTFQRSDRARRCRGILRATRARSRGGGSSAWAFARVRPRSGSRLRSRRRSRVSRNRLRARRGTVAVRIDDRLWPAVRVARFPRTELSEPMRAARTRARLVVDALQRRKTTLVRLGAALLERQAAYFAADGDESALVPLSGRELARDVGCAESTISRALASRFAATPFGTIPLRALIAKQPRRVGLTTATIRQHIAAIVGAVPNASDEAIARALALRGIRLARRTVAKYRGQLGIAPLHRRTVT